MSVNSIYNEYITELNRLLHEIKQCIILSKSSQDLISEFDELLNNFKQIYIPERKFNEVIQQYEKEIKNIKTQIDLDRINVNYNLNNLKRQNIDRIEVLKNARDNLISTEKVGENTLENLNIQNEKIISSLKKTNKINKDMNHSSKLTSKMSNWYHGLFK